MGRKTFNIHYRDDTAAAVAMITEDHRMTIHQLHVVLNIFESMVHYTKASIAGSTRRRFAEEHKGFTTPFI